MKKIEEDWEYENCFFITSITLLCSEFLKYSSHFCFKLLKNNFFNKILDYLLISKREQVIHFEIIKDTLKLIHRILKFKDNNIEFPLTNVEKILNILEIYYGDLISEKIFYNVVYILYYLTEDCDTTVFSLILKREKLLEKILEFEIDSTKAHDIIFILIISNLLRAEEDKLIDVKFKFFSIIIYKIKFTTYLTYINTNFLKNFYLYDYIVFNPKRSNRETFECI